MSATYLIICLIISIALVVLFRTKVKMNPAIALILGSLLLGVLTKVPLNDITAADGTVTNGLITVINNGFGNMMGSIGFPIGLGIILGQFVSDTGGATVIADKLVSLFPEKYAMYAVGFAGFILSIPVFFDVTFVILIPIGVALMKKLNKGIGYIVGAISIGAGIAHTLVPPTPNPLVAPEYFGFDLGVMIAAGLLFGIPMMIISVTIHGMLMKKGLWNAETDENGNGLNVDELELPEKLPSFGVSLLPIIIPIVLILLNTIVAVANNYNELSAIQVTVSRDDLPDEVEEVAFQLDDNAVSGMIAAGNGYYFIKCLNKYNEELTEANKSNIVEKREKEAFDDVYNEFVASLSSRLNTDLWDGIELITDGSIQTNSFFAVFEKYCGEI